LERAFVPAPVRLADGCDGRVLRSGDVSRSTPQRCRASSGVCVPKGRCDCQPADGAWCDSLSAVGHTHRKHLERCYERYLAHTGRDTLSSCLYYRIHAIRDAKALSAAHHHDSALLRPHLTQSVHCSAATAGQQRGRGFKFARNAAAHEVAEGGYVIN
jgi:hypothetical protein